MSKRSDFPPELPAVHTKYCFVCGASTIVKVVKAIDSGVQYVFFCSTCQTESERVRIWDPHMIQSFNADEELIHEGAGVIVQNERSEILLFMRSKYPFLWTIPGGHMSLGEDPKAAALRELAEEAGLTLSEATLVYTGTIDGDECMGGADVHVWHLFHAITSNTAVVLDEEGNSFAWFGLEALPKNLTFPVQYLLGLPVVQEALRSQD